MGEIEADVVDRSRHIIALVECLLRWMVSDDCSW
jgi:hypothetical protein